MLVAKIVEYYILFIFIYSTKILKFFGFDVMSNNPLDHPHWLIEWAVLTVVTVTMTVSLIFLLKRFISVIMEIYKKLKTITCLTQKQTKNK
ncbi:MAG: hypothetical protein AAB540_04615 [Patescibacteria group bacterium]